MQKKIDTNSPLYLLSDILLAAFAVSIVAGTYFGLGKLTPQLTPTQKVATVLGANSATEKVKFLPSIEKAPFISDSTATLSTTAPNNMAIDLQFAKLEETTYDFSVITVKNDTVQYKSIQVVPTFSLPNSLTTISLKSTDISSVIVNQNGEVFPIDLSVPPNTTMTFRLVVQPTAPIATPTSLQVVFTERQ